MTDSVSGHTGLVQNLSLRLDPQNVANATSRDVQTNGFSFDFVDVPLGATNLAVCLANESGSPLPLELYIRRDALPSLNTFDEALKIDASQGCLSVNCSTLPPLNPGRYYLGVFNSNTTPQTIRLNARVDVSPAPVTSVTIASAGSVQLPDDAITNASLFVSNSRPIAALEVALSVEHPRVSDMVFTLVSPAGTRVLLCENRGGATTNGLGGMVLLTNVFPRTNGNYVANTNVLQLDANQGTLYIDYEFYQDPDALRVYYDDYTQPIYNSGEVSLSNHVVIPFGPGASSNLVITVNEGNNTNESTLWEVHRLSRQSIPRAADFYREHEREPGPDQVRRASLRAGRHRLRALLPA